MRVLDNEELGVAQVEAQDQGRSNGGGGGHRG